MAADDVGQIQTLLRQVARPKPYYPPRHATLHAPLHATLHAPRLTSRQTKHGKYAERHPSSDDDILVIEEEQALKTCPSDLQCGECLDSFTAYPLLSAHLTFSHGNHDVFECGLCLKFFICHTHLDDHLVEAHLCLDRGVADMRLCNINEDEISHFMSHADHREMVQLQCPYCNCEFGKLALYQHHMSSAHHGRAWNKEGLCEAVLKVTPSGPVHQCSKPTIEVAEEQLRSKVFTCNYCTRQFFGKEPMRRHAALHRPDNTFQCSQCSCYFSSEGRLEEHMTCQHILLDQQNIKQNLHGDMIGVSLEDVLNANDSLATTSQATVKTTMRRSSTWSKSNKALSKARTIARPQRILPKLAPKPSTQQPRPAPKPSAQQPRPKLSITSVQSHCAKNKRSCAQQSTLHSSILASDRTFVKLPHPIPAHSLPAASAIVKHCSDTQPKQSTVLPSKVTLKPSTGPPTASVHANPEASVPSPHWKTHKRSSSEDSLPEEDHPLHKLLVLCRYAKREQTRLRSEVTVIEPSKEVEEDIEIEIIDTPYTANTDPHSYTTNSSQPTPDANDANMATGTQSVEAPCAQFMLDTFATCTTSEELQAFARGFLSVHLLLIHIAALSLSTMEYAVHY